MSEKRAVRFNRFWTNNRPHIRASCRCWHLPIKFILSGFIRAHPRDPSLNGCKECLGQSRTRSPSRSQVSRHDEWECGWSIYSGALWAEDAIQTGWQTSTDNQRAEVLTLDETEVLTLA